MMRLVCICEDVFILYVWMCMNIYMYIYTIYICIGLCEYICLYTSSICVYTYMYIVEIALMTK
jgi:hypothetical protein